MFPLFSFLQIRRMKIVSFLKLTIYLSIYFDERQKEISHLYIYHANIYYGQKLEMHGWKIKTIKEIIMLIFIMARSWKIKTIKENIMLIFIMAINRIAIKRQSRRLPKPIQRLYWFEHYKKGSPVKCINEVCEKQPRTPLQAKALIFTHCSYLCHFIL